ncbi:MAG: ribonuclease H-like domain-containing protein [Nitrospira defluvii]|nr:ribonuclease H-like domain-containing protein [Nitrospira defluvii]
MITSTFCLLPGIGVRTERRFWREGLSTWDRFLTTPVVRGISGARKALFDDRIAEAQKRFTRGDSRYFATAVAPRHQWRLYEWLRERALYLDIETDCFGQITVVGLFGRDGYTALVQGESLGLLRLRAELSRYDLLITFCGSTFDLPMLRAHFPDLPLEQPHIDLCGVSRQLGYRGGLKAIERTMGIDRVEALQGFSGQDAVRQWNRWRHQRDENARRLLLAYNEADCVNLQPLADAFYCRLVQASGLGEVPVGPTGNIRQVCEKNEAGRDA